MNGVSETVIAKTYDDIQSNVERDVENKSHVTRFVESFVALLVRNFGNGKFIHRWILRNSVLVARG